MKVTRILWAWKIIGNLICPESNFIMQDFKLLWTKKVCLINLSASVIFLHFLLCPALSLTSLHILHSVPVSVQCYLDDQWWMKKEARLRSAVTQSDVSFSSDHRRGLLTLQRHNPLPQHFSLSQCVCVFMYCTCEFRGSACARMHVSWHNWWAVEGVKALPDGTVCVGVCRDGGEEYSEAAAWLRWALQLRPKNHLLFRTRW